MFENVLFASSLIAALVIGLLYFRDLGDISVLVIENNGLARAHPDSHLLRPHLAGNDEGLDGENVIMTYCAIANLGLGYIPEINEKQMD